MQRKNVINLLNDELENLIDEYREVHLDGAFYTPSFIIPLVCYLNSNPIDKEKFGVHPDNKSYFTTIGLYKQLWNKNDSFIRNNCGKTYSPVIRLDSAEHVDKATTDIGNCIHSMLEGKRSEGVAKLLDVIGELHDNVWSHGKSTGFSMAQTYIDPKLGNRFIEFTIADKGRGFLTEMISVGKIVNSHQEAIEWCIQEGNSTKHADDEDAWMQRVPGDLIGNNPMGVFGGEIDENHHQGLGLFHLIDLIESFSGELYLISGNTALHISNNKRSYHKLKHDWKGVVISCRFFQDKLINTVHRNTIKDEKIDSIIKILRG